MKEPLANLQLSVTTRTDVWMHGRTTREMKLLLYDIITSSGIRFAANWFLVCWVGNCDSTAFVLGFAVE